jgi:biotin synthase
LPGSLERLKEAACPDGSRLAQAMPPGRDNGADKVHDNEPCRRTTAFVSLSALVVQLSYLSVHPPSSGLDKPRSPSYQLRDPGGSAEFDDFPTQSDRVNMTPSAQTAQSLPPRHDWTRAEVQALFDLPFADLIFRAQSIHRASFDPNEVQMSTLLSIKTGGCPEDCGYCSQSAHFETGLKATKLMDTQSVLESAKRAKEGGASRFCMGAAWRSPKDRDMDAVCDMVAGVKAMGMETCMTLGMLTPGQAARLKTAGLDYYNHNIDTSPEYYAKVISTRTMEDRLDTLANVRDAGINVCCGGIVGMGEAEEDRAGMLLTLANLPAHPESVPINALMQVKGTRLGESAPIDGLDFVRTIAVARIMMPRSVVRLSAGRENMSDELQAMCFLAGANSIFIGEKLLTTSNPKKDRDDALWAKLGVRAMEPASQHKHGVAAE